MSLFPTTIERAATFSPCKTFRYTLSRRWSEGKLVAAFVMLNPSTADASIDDPTIRRCMSFARSWGYHGIEVVNLFALRSPNPQDLIDSAEAGVDPIGSKNDAAIDSTCSRCAKVVAAWGAHPFAVNRAKAVLTIKGLGMFVECLGTTKDGSPRHPLYVKADQPLIAYQYDINRPAGARP